MPTLLIVDDEPNVRYSLEKALRSDTLHLLTAGTAEEGIACVRGQQPDAVILDVCLPDLSGLEAFDRIRVLDPRLPVIVITAQASTETAIEAMKRGAFEYLLKPVDLHELRDLVQKATELSRARHVPAVFDQDAPGEVGDRIVGRSPVMQQVYKAIGRIAPQHVPVLLLGESGTGKELVARAILHHSARAAAPFLTINCAAIPETLLESELFGHERGAFTGADRQRIGKFEQAHGGTIFLDEVGDMSEPTQAKVLRLLQQQQFERLGGNETVQTDVRIIAATNKDLEDLVRRNRFRYDLLYRLNSFTIRLPPLRERIDDIPLLAEHFIRQLNGRLGRRVRHIVPETHDLLQQHTWPGNVRELQNVIKYALVYATGDVLLPDSLPRSLDRKERPRESPSLSTDGTGVAHFVRSLLHRGETDIYRAVCQAVDRAVLHEVLLHTDGNQVQASELLGISRTTLRGKLRTLNVTLEKRTVREGE